MLESASPILSETRHRSREQRYASIAVVCCLRRVRVIPRAKWSLLLSKTVCDQISSKQEYNARDCTYRSSAGVYTTTKRNYYVSVIVTETVGGHYHLGIQQALIGAGSPITSTPGPLRFLPHTDDT